MDQFRSFKEFVRKIDHYGMQSGIVKIIPPAEWYVFGPPSRIKTQNNANPIILGAIHYPS